MTLYSGTGVILVRKTAGNLSMPLSIGQRASAGGVGVETLRYYERRGLVTAARRTPAGYRQYGEDAVARLKFIRRAQELGFSLKEIQELLALRVRHGAACGPVEPNTPHKLELGTRKIQDLTRIAATLERLADACAARCPTDECPILEALEDHALARS